MKKKLLVIDDRWDGRAETYLKVLASDFEVIPVEKGSQLFEMISTQEVDAYLVDIVLSRWRDKNDNPQQVLPVLEKIEKNKPIILVSGEYENLLKDEKLTPLINSIIDKDYNVNSFLIWSDFVKAAETQDIDNTETIQSKIKLDILKNKKFEIKKAEKRFDFAIICALGEELKPFMDKAQIIDNVIVENIHINICRFSTKTGNELRYMTVQLEEMGSIDSAIVTSKVVSEFKIEHVFMIGVCGGRDGNVKIGDIIIPHEIVAYQNGKIGEEGFRINIGYAKSKGNIKGAIENKCDQIINNIFEKYIHDNAKKGIVLSVNRPSLVFDPMACGAVVINKVGELERISEETAKPKLCAIDMESFSIYRICEILNIKASVIKSVMDLSSDKSDKYKDYAAYISANFLYDILYNEILRF